MFDFLVSADLLIDDLPLAVTTLRDRLGFASPKPHWYGGGPGKGFDVVFLRTHPSLAGSPTRLEVMAAGELDPTVPSPRTLPHMPGLRRAQETLPVRTHGTVFAVSDMEAAIERVRSGGFRHWLDAANDLVTQHRLWVGVSEVEKDVWIPGDDGGLLVELVETASLPGVMESADQAPPPLEAPPGTMTRIVARRWLVPDVEQSVARLHATFDCAIGDVRCATDGSETAPVLCAHPRSAVVDLVEPAPDSADADLVAACGPVPWTIVIAVDDLEAKAADLAERATPFVRTEDQITGAPAIAPDPSCTLGVPFQFVAEDR